MVKDNPNIYILNRHEFDKVAGKRGSDFKNVPTPALTSVGKRTKESEIAINLIAIDEEFLPDEKRDEYFRCLVEHELAEFDFYVKNPEEYEKAARQAKLGEAVNPIAHLHALREELKVAKEFGILDEYNKHWKNWMESKLKEIKDEKIIEAAKERIKWREEAFKEVNKEFDGENKELRNPLR